jgi:hypothetical protein
MSGIYLFLVLMWGLVAIMLFVLSGENPDSPYLHIGGTGISMGWVALALLLYNLLRLLTQRSVRTTRRPGRPTRPTPVERADDELPWPRDEPESPHQGENNR